MTFVALIAALAPLPPQDTEFRPDAERALKKAVTYFRTRVATEGGYLWRYSEDLSRREGEGKTDEHAVWVQPPGTPAVGLTYLHAWRSTGDAFYLEAARDVGRCLVKGQLRSGGWASGIYFDERGRKRYAYRTNPEGVGKRNITSLDDNKTQSAVRFLALLDEALEFEDEKIHEAAGYALDSILKAQYPNGGFAHRYDAPSDPDAFPVRKAGYPESWPREFPDKEYRRFYTLNDNLLPDLTAALLEAHRVYKDKRFLDAVRRIGDFLILAQMPDPQPAWAQQYNFEMHPVWARRFEPPAVTGGESQGAMRTLITVARATGERKYLQPIPRSLAYLRKSLLDGGRLARFYELRTNRPLYFTKDYTLTYSDADMPTHYGFKTGASLDSIERDYTRADEMKEGDVTPPRRRSTPRFSTGLEKRVKGIVKALDDKGRWVEDGRLRYHGDDDPTRRILSCRTFSRNVAALSDYLASTRR